MQLNHARPPQRGWNLTAHLAQFAEQLLALIWAGTVLALPGTAWLKQVQDCSQQAVPSIVSFEKKKFCSMLQMLPMGFALTLSANIYILPVQPLEDWFKVLK